MRGKAKDSPTIERLPDWLKPGLKPSGLRPMKGFLRGHRLWTVCEEARCPNKAECFSRPTATFMILGSECTRGCGFCSVRSASPAPPDPDEPERVALASKELGLKYVVVTSVTRDDLEDGGAGHFALTIDAIRRHLPEARIEVLTPDFGGSEDAIRKVIHARPDVYNHNVETVPRLYSTVRPRADYARSLRLLEFVKETSPDMKTKSGLMLGLGETYDEVKDVMLDLRRVGCDYITIGQYMRPSRKNLAVVKYVDPGTFERLGEEARSMGFIAAASAPLVRSSMNAEEMHEGRHV